MTSQKQPLRLETPAPPSIQTHRDNRPVHVVVAPASRGLHIRFETQREICNRCNATPGGVFVNESRVRNNCPPSPVDWQQVVAFKDIATTDSKRIQRHLALFQQRKPIRSS